MLKFFSTGCVILLVIWPAASRFAAQDTAPARTTDDKPKTPPPSLGELGDLYRALELPLPPKEAFFPITGCFNHPLMYAQSNEEFYYQLHFATGGPYPKLNYQVWQGFEEFPSKKLEVIFTRPPRPETVLRYLKTSGIALPTDRQAEGYGDLVFAIQCHLLQHFDLAKFFYGRCEKKIEEPLNQSLVLLAWNYWAGELANPKRDRAEVARKLHFLVDKHRFYDALRAVDTINDARNQDHRQKHQDLLDRLDLTVKPNQTKPGSIESIIDEFLDDPKARGNEWSWSRLGANVPVDEEPPNQEVRKKPGQGSPIDTETKLRNMGFAAIPLLIEHVDDERLVRYPILPLFLQQGEPTGVMTLDSHDFPSVGHSVRKTLSAFFDLDQQKATKADYQNAWNELKVTTESAFVRKRLNNIQDINHDLIEFIAAKYKTEAKKAYEALLLKEIDFDHSGAFLDLVVNSDMPRAAKLDLLRRRAQSSRVHVTRDALTRLLELDNAVFSRACVASLEKLTWNGDGESADRICVRIIEMAFRTEDRKTRETVEKYVKDLPVNQRLAVVKELSSDGTVRPLSPEALSFLCTFLDDATVYQDPEGEKVGFRNLESAVSEMEIRNFVTLQILKNIGVDISNRVERDEREWSRIREFAKGEVNRRLKNTKRQ